MKRYYLLPIMVLFLLSFVVPYTKVSAQETVRTINVSGASEFYVAPDQASIEIGIETTASTAKAATANNAAVMTRIQNGLKNIGIQENDIKTSSYNFYPEYDDNQNIKSYRAQNTIIVTTHDINQVGNIIDTAINNGANNIRAVKFGISDVKKYKETALKAAVRDAKDKSKAIASELGKHVINVVSVSEGNVYVENYRAANMDMKAVGTSLMATPIKAQDVKVSANITVTFEMD